MQIACVEGIAALARASSSAEAAAAYQGERLSFGRDYLIPKAFDPRLLAIVASAVAEAAMETGVATRPVADLDAYRAELNRSVYRSAFIMRRVFEAARSVGRRIVFAEGEDERVLHAVHAMNEEGIGRPILIGRPEVIEQRCERNAIPLQVGRDFELVNPEDDPRYREYWGTYHAIMQRRGRHARSRAGDHAHQHHGDRRGDGASRRGRQPDLRHLRPVSLAPEVRPARCWAAARRGCTRSARCR